jgi:hypothetical protein
MSIKIKEYTTNVRVGHSDKADPSNLTLRANAVRYAARAIGRQWPLFDQEAQIQILNDFAAARESGIGVIDPDAMDRAMACGEELRAAGMVGKQAPERPKVDHSQLTRGRRIAAQIARQENADLAAEFANYEKHTALAKDGRYAFAASANHSKAEAAKAILADADWDWDFAILARDVVRAK